MAIIFIDDITDNMNLINKAEFDAGFSISGISDTPGSVVTLVLGTLTLTFTSDATTGAFDFALTNAQLMSSGIMDGTVNFTLSDDGGLTTSSGSFVMDMTPPTAPTITVSDMSVTDGETANFTIALEYNELMDESGLNDPSVNLSFLPDGFTLVGGAWSNDGSVSTYTVTYTVVDMDEEVANIDIMVSGGVDVAGNPAASATEFAAFSVDTSAPIAPSVSLDMDTTDGTTGNDIDGVTSNGLVNVLGLEAGATWMYSTDGGSSFIAGTGNSFMLPAIDADYDIVVRQIDAAGNVSPDSVPVTYTLDTDADVGDDLTVSFDEMQISAAESGAISVTIAGLDANTEGTLVISTSGGATTQTVAVSGNGPIPGIDISALEDGSLTATLMVADDAGNMATAAQGNSAVLDTMSPTLLSAVFSDIDGTNGEISDLDASGAGAGVTLTLTFSEAMDTSTNPTIGLNTTDLAEVMGSGIWNLAGTEFSITYNVINNNNELADITVDVSNASDAAGNNLTAVMGVSSATAIDTLNLDNEDETNPIDEITDQDAASTGTIINLGSLDGADGATWVLDGAGGVYDHVEIVADGDGGFDVRILDTADARGFFDFEGTGSPILIDVIGTDDAGNTTNSTITVTLNDLNDAPQIDSTQSGLVGMLTERADTNDAAENDPVGFEVSGEFFFTDDDSINFDNQTHLISIAPGDAYDTNGNSLGFSFGEFTAGIEDQAPNDGGTGRVAWNYENLEAGDMAMIDALAAGETITLEFIVTLTEQNTPDEFSVSETVRIVITGTNDAPTITATATTDVASIVEEGDGILAEDGSFNVEDVDVSDSVTVTAIDVSTSMNSTLDGQDLAALFMAEFGQTIIDGMSTTGQVDWAFNAPAGAFDYLAHDEVIEITYTVTLTDSQGATVTQDVDITINGTNDQPVISVVGNDSDSASLSEFAMVTAGTGTLGRSGTLTVSDADASDTLTIAAELGSVAWEDGSNAAITSATLPAGLMDLLANPATFTAALDGTNSNEIDWTFALADSEVDFLAAGEELILTYNITADDGNLFDGDPDDEYSLSAIQTVIITITGTNDMPTITSADAVGGVTEVVEDTDPLNGVEGDTLTDTGVIVFADVDITDVHVASAAAPSVTPSSGVALPSGVTELGSFTVSIDTVTNEVTWDFEVEDEDIDFLAAGETVTQVYTVTIDDQSGTSNATVTQTVTITITGTNDAPVITASGTDIAQTISEIAETMNPTADAGPLVATGTLALDDVDATDTFTAEITGVTVTPSDALPSSGFAPGEVLDMLSLVDQDISTLGVIDVSETTGIVWNFASTDARFDYLAADEYIEFVYTIQVNDNNGGSDEQTVTIRINGANDLPDITVTNPNEDTEGNSLVIVDGVLDGLAADDTVTIDLLNDTIDGLPGGTPITNIVEVDESDAQSVGNISFALGAGTATIELDDGTNLTPVPNPGVAATSAQILALFSVNADGEVEYNRNDPIFDALEAGESIFIDITYDVTSGPNTTTHMVTLEIQGQNDAPFFTSPASAFISPTLTEHADNSADEMNDVSHDLNLRVQFDDVELNDTHRANIVAVTGPDTADTVNDYVGLFSGGIVPADQATGSGTGEVRFDFSVDDSLIDNLAEGEILVQRYEVQVEDNNGAIVTRDIVVTIVGTNDAPVITGVEDGFGMALTAMDLALVEDRGAEITGASSMQNISGTIEFDDVDVNSLAAADDSLMDTEDSVVADTHLVTATVSSVSIGGVAQTGYTGPTGALTFDTTAANAANAVSNSVGFDFDINDADFDFLAADEVFSITYTVTVNDQRSVDNTDTVDVTFTITGTNDAPVITAGGSVSVAETADTSNIEASITVNFTDADLSDVGHSASIAAASVHAGTGNGMTMTELVDLITNISTTKEAGSSSGSVVLDFSAASTAFDYLSSTESVTIRYTLRVDDGDGGVTTEYFDIVITGTNDVPVIAAGASAAATETTDSNAVTTALTVNFTDVDLSDVGHAASVTGVYTTSGVDDGLAGLTLTDYISVASTIKADGSSSGSVALNFSAASTVFDYLAADETVTITYILEVDDGNGGVSTENFDIVVTGTNDVPVIAAGASETVAETVDTSDIQTSITVNFTDVDLNDVGHSASIEAASATTNAPSGLTPLAGLDLTTLISNISTTKDEGSSSGTVVLDFLAASTVFDYLAVDESVTITYTLRVDDGDVGVTTEDFVITVTGTNDAPTIVTGSTNDAGGVTEIAEGTMAPDPVEGDMLSDTGTITFADVDLSDMHMATIINSTTTHTSALGMLELAPVNNATDTVQWTFTVSDADIDFLNEGETITQVYTVEIDDQNGGTVEQDVTIRITGRNDAPVLSSESFSITDNVGPVLDLNAALTLADNDNMLSQDDPLDGLPYADDETFTVTGQLDATDSDATAELTFTIDGLLPATGATTTSMTLSAMFNGASVDFGVLTVDEDGSYVFVGNAAALNSLDVSDVITLMTNVRVTDDNDAVDTETITITLNGVNDAPIAIDDAISVVQDATILFNVILDDSGDLNADFDAEDHALTVISIEDSDDTTGNINPDVDGNFIMDNSDTVTALDGQIVTDWGALVTIEQDGSVNYNLSSTGGAFQSLRDGETAIDTFTYTIQDGNDPNLTSTATVSVTITGINDQIFANSDSITATENVDDDPMDNGDLAGDLLANDTDVDFGDTKEIVLVVAGANSNVSTVADGMGATVGFDVDLGQGVIIHVLTDGTYTVEIPESLAVTDSLTGSFSYTVEDSGGLQSTTTVSFTVNGANDPVEDGAENVSATVTEDDGLQSVDLLSQVSDMDAADILSVVETTFIQTNATMPVTPANDGGGATFNPATNELDIDTNYYNYLAEGESVVLEYQYDVTDSNGSTITEFATITINGANDAPTVTSVNPVTLVEGNSVTPDVQTIDIFADLVTATDPDATDMQSLDNMSVMVESAGGAPLGLIGNALDGQITYDLADFDYLAVGESAVYEITFDVISGSDTVQQTVTLTVTGENDAPVVEAINTSVSEDGSADGSGIIIVPDFIDVDGSDTHIITVDTTNTVGSVVVNADGTFTYDPNGAFETLADEVTTTDTFTYTVDDGNGGVVTETVTVTIMGQNDAPVLTADVNAATDNYDIDTGTGAATGNVLVNDSDVDMGDVLSVVLPNGMPMDVIEGDYGTLTIHANGDYEYIVTDESIDDGFTGMDVFDIDVTDGIDTSRSTLTINVTGTNDVPVVMADMNSATDDGMAVTGNVLDNDSDVDANDTLVVSNSGIFEGDYGTLTLNGDGSYRYIVTDETLPDGFTGTESFTVNVTDGTATVTSTLEIMITGSNDAPMAAAISGATTEDGPDNTITLAAVFTDVDTDDTHSFMADAVSAAGVTIVNNNDGTFTYDPGTTFDFLSEGETTTDTFSYTVDDGNGGTSTATATITITGQNDAPVAADVTATVMQNGPFITVMADFVDPDLADTFTFTFDDSSTIGSVTNLGNGNFSYDPIGQFESLGVDETATDSFTYTVTDSEGVSSTATVLVTITGQNDAPQVTAGVRADVNDDDASFVLQLLDGAFDPDTNDTLSITNLTLVSGDARGVVVNGLTLEVDPTAYDFLNVGDVETITYSYEIIDGNNGSVTQIATIEIDGINDAAVITGDISTTATEGAGGSVTGQLSHTDVDNDDGVFQAAGGTLSYGSYTVDATGAWEYVLDDTNATVDALNVGDSLTETFDVLAEDGTIQTITITIDGTNDAAMISGDVSATATEDAGGSVAGQLSHTDVDNDDGVFQVAGGTLSYGSYTVDATGAWEYVLDDTNATVDALNVGDSLTETFDVLAEDGTIQTITITIDGTNDAAVISGDVSATATEGAGGSVTGQLSHTDVDNDDGVFQVAGGTLSYGSYTVDATGAWEYVLDDTNATVDALNVGDSLTETFDVLAEDGTIQTITITIDGTNDAAVISGDVSATATEGAGGSVTGQLSHTDVDNDDGVFQADGGTLSYGSYSVTEMGAWEYVLDDTNATVDALNVGDSLTETFDVLAEDGTIQTITITIDGTNDAAMISGTTTGSVDENSGVSATGTLTSTDVDNDDDTFQANAAAAAYGSFTVDAMGNWTYTVDDTNADVNALNDGETLTDSFDVLTQDGTVQTITITINGANDSGMGTPNEDTLIGGEGDDVLVGLGSNDTLIGNGGDDLLEGGEGADSLDGGTGNDTASYENAATRVVADLGAGSGSAGEAAGDTYTSIENLIGSAFNDTLIGDALDNIINGGAGADRITGGDGNDTLIGGDGADTFLEGAGADSIDGGAGFDTVDYRNSSSGIVLSLAVGGTVGDAAGDTYVSIERVFGTDFNDTINGSAANEFLFGEGGNDTINGGAGIDRIFGGDGNDIQRGQEGNDTLFGSAGADQLNGGIGLDIANYSLSESRVELNLATGGTVGDAAGDTYFGIEIVFATSFDDIITGNNGTNDLRGLAGNDELNGEGGNDRLYGGLGADVLNGGDGIDAAFYTLAEEGVTLDLALGGTGGEAAGDSYSSIEWVFGSAFDDDITGDAGANNLFGGAGNDILNGDDGNDRIQGGDGDDTINGGDGVDTIFGQDGNDTLSGGAGNDFFFGSDGGDSFDGGADFDTVSYLASSSGIITDLGGTGTGGDATGDSYVNIERLLATNFDDTIQGGSGDETLQGLGGDDTIGGGAGADSLFGGAGVDTFLYDTSADGADVISDFRGGSLGDEVIVLTDNNPDFDSFAEVQAAATQVGNNVIINFGGGNTLTLANYNLTHLNASAFQFGVSQAPLSDDSFDFGASSNAAPALDMDLRSLSDAESNSLLALAEVDPEYAQLLQGMWEDSNATESADFADLSDSLI